MPTSDNRPAPRSGFGRRIALLALIVALLATALLACLANRAEQRLIISGVDEKLRAIAAAMPDLLPANYHRRVTAGEIPEVEYRGLVNHLSQLARDAGVQYLYTCVRRGDEILLACSSATDKELAEGTWSRMLDRYKEPPPELAAVFGDSITRTAEYTDEFGSFRSMFIAHSPVGTDNAVYVVGADVRLDELQHQQWLNLASLLGAGLAVALAVGAAGIWAGHRLGRPITRLTHFVRTFTDGDFNNDDQSVAGLDQLASRDRTETGELAATFLHMRVSLLEHIERLKTITAEKERVQSQLRIARDIQRALLPERAPALPGFDIAGWSEPADETGGDFYDWMTANDGTLIVEVADATGHGLGPAMMAAVCRAYARATLAESRPLASLVEQLNRLVCIDARDGHFVTFFALRLDPRTGGVQILSAGHGPALHHIARTGEVRQLGTHGLPLGVIDVPLEIGTELTIEPGDSLLIVSDGFFEWMNSKREQFGIQRLAEAFKGAAGGSAAQVIAALRLAIIDFTAGTPQPDDMTAVVIRRM